MLLKIHDNLVKNSVCTYVNRILLTFSIFKQLERVGRSFQVAMTLPTNERFQIVIPAQGMVDVRDTLTDILNEHGKDDEGQ